MTFHTQKVCGFHKNDSMGYKKWRDGEMGDARERRVRERSKREVDRRIQKRH